MNKLFYFYAVKKRFLVCCVALFASLNFQAQDVKIIKMPELMEMIHNADDTLLLLNFWASWCKPCLNELPAFEKTAQTKHQIPFKILLISLDNIKDTLSRLKPLILQRKLQLSVYLLDERDYNSWIDKVDKAWGGSIPATLAVRHRMKFRQFFENELSQADIENILSDASKK